MRAGPPHKAQGTATRTPQGLAGPRGGPRCPRYAAGALLGPGVTSAVTALDVAAGSQPSTPARQAAPCCSALPPARPGLGLGLGLSAPARPLSAPLTPARAAQGAPRTAPGRAFERRPPGSQQSNWAARGGGGRAAAAAAGRLRRGRRDASLGRLASRQHLGEARGRGPQGQLQGGGFPWGAFERGAPGAGPAGRHSRTHQWRSMTPLPL